MTGKADAVRAVTQQFKDRANTVIEGVLAHLRDDNAKEILGPGLSPLVGRGTLKGLVTCAIYADVLRMVRDVVMADGEISDEEVQESLGLLQIIAGGFAKVRSKDYGALTQLTPETARRFLSQYESDAGLFGHANESTKWAGVTLCSGVKTLCGDPAPITELHSLLMAWAKSLAETDGTAGVEQEVLGSLQSLLRAHLLAGKATESNDNDDEADDEESVDCEQRPKRNTRNTTSTFRCSVCNTAFTIEYDRVDMDRWKNGEGYVQDILSYLTDDERELILSGTCGKCFDKLYASDGSAAHSEPPF